MPFEQVDTIRGVAKEVRASISYSRPGRSNPNKDRSAVLPRLLIGIPKALAGSFSVDTEKDRFALLVGNGKDAGKAQIVRSGTGLGTGKNLKGAVTFRFGFLPMLGTDAAAREMIDSRPIEKGFEITLPPWFKSDEPEPVNAPPPEKKAKK